ncbi:MAG: hypothetical protein ACLP5H_02220 [Desulfomonilaceae bacterium]
MPYYDSEEKLLLLLLQDWGRNEDKENLFLMGFLRPILLILLLTGLSLAVLVVLGIIFPDAFGAGSGGFLLYVAGASLIFLFFLKRHSGGPQSERAEGTSETAAQNSADKRLDEIRDRIRDRKRTRK